MTGGQVRKIADVYQRRASIIESERLGLRDKHDEHLRLVEALRRDLGEYQKQLQATRHVASGSSCVNSVLEVSVAGAQCCDAMRDVVARIKELETEAMRLQNEYSELGRTLLRLHTKADFLREHGISVKKQRVRRALRRDVAGSEAVVRP